MASNGDAFRSIDRFFADMLRGLETTFQSFRQELSDAWEQSLGNTIQNHSTESQFRLSVNVSDFGPEEVQVTIRNRHIHIRAQRHGSAANSHRARTIQTIYALPSNVREEQVKKNSIQKEKKNQTNKILRFKLI